MKTSVSYDFVIVGGGASGCVLANRLSAIPGISVLLLEAGQDNEDVRVKGLTGFTSLWGSDFDWQINTTPQEALSGRRITINQGKTLGGSTSINAMMYVRGDHRNFDQWEKAGGKGWNYQSVLPYFKSIENYEDGASEYHGEEGEIPVTVCPDPVMRSAHFLDAAREYGFVDSDYNGPVLENSAGLLQFHIGADGERYNSYRAFLKPVQNRKNLHILTGATVTRLITNKNQITGVEFVQKNQEQTVLASREVILSAGALLTPKLLLLSGIGPAEELASLGTELVTDLPRVGKNLQDHLQLPMVFRSKIPLPSTDLLTGNALFTKVLEQSTVTDLQINFTPSAPKPLLPLLPDFGGPVCIFLPILVQPYSRGDVKLASLDPAAAPLVNPGYLTHPNDIRILTEAVKLVRKLSQSDAFSSLNDGEITPGESTDIETFARTQSSTLWHPAGTCSLGNGPADSVTDHRLRVHNLKGLRIADASVMPTITSGNTVAACFMIGAKAADMILEDHHLSNHLI